MENNTSNIPAPAASAENKRSSPIFFIMRTIFLDITLAGIAICIFALFHHVIPISQTKGQVVESIGTVNAETEATIQTGEPVPDSPESGDSSSGSDIAEASSPPKTEWQERFADKFTDEIVVTANHYSSPDICIDITSDIFKDEYGRETKVYVADIYIGSIDCFRTYFAGGQYISGQTDHMKNLIEQSKAILSINGDFANLYTSQGTFLVRNGEVYFKGKAYMCDICILNEDGTMDVYRQEDFNATAIDDIMAKQPYNSWRFGPSLLDSDGHASKNMYIAEKSVMYNNPRAAIGYYEPGHYCFLTCDGRSDAARGLYIWELASYFESLGCSAAYNLDGGASAMMKFNGKTVNVITVDWRTDEERLIGDIVLIGEPEDKQGVCK